jgi:hypothetical protein
MNTSAVDPDHPADGVRLRMNKNPMKKVQNLILLIIKE